MIDTEKFQTMIIELLEQQAFLDGDPISGDELPGAIEDGLCVALEYKNSTISGLFRMNCPRELADELAASVLGLDGPEDVSEEDAFDAVGELVNVIAGRVLAALVPQDEAFNIGAPQLSQDSDGSLWTESSSTEDACAFLVEDFPTLFSFTLSEAA